MKSAVHVHNLHVTFIPHSWLFIAFETRVTRRVPLVEQKLLTLSVYKDLYLWISCCSIFRFLFRSLFLLLYFFYLLCCLSIYGFWLSL